MNLKIVILLTIVINTYFFTFSQTQDTLIINNYQEVKPYLKEGMFSLIEQGPMYPNGEAGVLQYIMENLKYPQEAKKERIEGKVILSYYIEKDGSIGEIKVVKSVHPLLDNEAIRVIKSMDKWKPAIQRGEIVRILLQQEFNFNL